MKKVFKLLAFAMFAMISIQALAQDRPYQGKFSGVLNGRECTLDINLYEPTIETQGRIKYNPEGQYQSLPEVTNINCLGTFNFYNGGDVNYNIITFSPGDDVDPDTFSMFPNMENNPQSVVYVFIKANSDNSVTISDLSDAQGGPLFENLTLKRVTQ